MGIPVVGCHCEVCRSSSPFNKRLRSSALLEVFGKNFLIDAGPDFRMQALRAGLDTLDGMLLTHAHHDHTGGLDELRAFYLRTRRSLPCLLSDDTLRDVKSRYQYIFDPDPNYPALLPHFALRMLPDERGEIDFEAMRVRYFTYTQLSMAVNGFRFGDLAYVSDISHYPETIFEDLEGVRCLVLSALRFQPSPMHLTIDQAIAFAERVKAESTWLTHLAHELDHDRANGYLPPSVRLAYDGLAVNFLPEAT